MPIYEYGCEVCGQRFEKLFLSLSRIPDQIECPACHDIQVRRLVSKPAKRKGGEGDEASSFDEGIAEPIAPPVLGRKEILAAQEKKRNIDPFEP